MVDIKNGRQVGGGRGCEARSTQGKVFLEDKLAVLGGFRDKGAPKPFWNLCVGGFEWF